MFKNPILMVWCFFFGLRPSGGSTGCWPDPFAGCTAVGVDPVVFVGTVFVPIEVAAGMVAANSGCVVGLSSIVQPKLGLGSRPRF